ncbi:MAG: OmpH family outer membrane protein, partial [Gammaproteobacteria bacterium]|nr:OmpH family outer membrane protein [Gemmatimonadota bacterium]NIU79564.1 OmpH family outer membrane protein [Gammaproteobacteria bacterium]
EQQAQARQQELMQPIMAKIERVLEEIREEQGYIMIFDAASSGLIAADPTLDLTSEVLQRLQALASSG